MFRISNIEQIPEKNDLYLKEMTDISTSYQGISKDELDYLSSDSTSRQLKVFLLSLARNELQRVVRLTEALNDLEKTFIEEAVENKDELNLGTLSEIMKTVVNSLNRSTELIYKVMNDESIKLIIDNSTNIFNAPGSQVVILEDPSSREKVKKLANQLLEQITKEVGE